VFALENLGISKKKKSGKRFNRMLGGWPYAELLLFIQYKAEAKGKCAVLVNPKYTSLWCSKCGFVHKQNRQGLGFRCGNCGFSLNADLNAGRSIGCLACLSALGFLPMGHMRRQMERCLRVQWMATASP
jgi:transposase